MRRQRFHSALVVTLLLASVRPLPAVDLGDGRIHLKNETYERALGPASDAEVLERADPGALDTWIVAFQPPADDAIRETVERHGSIVGYVPSSAYLVRASDAKIEALRDEPGIDRVDRYRARWKIAREVERPGVEVLTAQIFEGESAESVAERARALGLEVLVVTDRPGLRRLRVRGASAQAEVLARLPEVEWIEPLGQATPRNDVVRWVIQSNLEDSVPLHDRGLLGEGQIVGHIDGRIAHLSCYFRDLVDPDPGPAHRKIVAYRSVNGFGGDFHGTHTAGTVAGDSQPVDGLVANRGMAPLARLAHTNIEGLNGNWNGLPSNLYDLLQAAHFDGARIHTNSWGDDNLTTYTEWSRDVDRFTRDRQNALVLFAVSNGSSVKTPENAKNCLAVAATQRAPNQHRLGSGGAGPTADGRRKPEVLAPGIDTRSAAAQPCAVLSQRGTSMACPAVAGGAALVREYYLRGFYPSGRERAGDALTPTGALLKATIINSSVDMDGIAGYPSANEGWGRILLDDALQFEGDLGKLWVQDVRHSDGLSTGELDTYRFDVANASLPLKITLVYTDEPASLGASVATVNDLDLEVVGPGEAFLGNVFDEALGISRAGGSPDARNNVERVIVADPTPGSWTLRVRARNVPFGPQGYAIVVNGRLGRRAFSPGDVPVDHERPDQPESFALSMGPNPFRQEAVIRYSVPGPSRVMLRVHDLRGRTVRVLADREVGPGSFTATWDGRDSDGRVAAPGVYLVRMEAPGYQETVRGVFIR